MKKYLKILKDCALFRQIGAEDLLKMLVCLGARVEFFDKKYTIIAEGSPAKYIGIVLSGSVHPEIVAQAGCVHMLTNEANKGKLAYFMGIDRTDFYGAVLPGDQMRLEVEIPDTTKRFGKGEGYLYVDDKVISKTNLTFAIVDA